MLQYNRHRRYRTGRKEATRRSFLFINRRQALMGQIREHQKQRKKLESELLTRGKLSYVSHHDQSSSVMWPHHSHMFLQTRSSLCLFACIVFVERPIFAYLNCNWLSLSRTNPMYCQKASDYNSRHSRKKKTLHFFECGKREMKLIFVNHTAKSLSILSQNTIIMVAFPHLYTINSKSTINQHKQSPAQHY